MRQWVLSLPIPLRYLLATHPHLLSPVLQVIQRAISTFLIKQAVLKRLDAQTGAITLIQRFGSAANLNIHLHCLVLDGAYRIQNGVPEFHGVRTPVAEQLQGLLGVLRYNMSELYYVAGFRLPLLPILASQDELSPQIECCAPL